MLTLITRVLTTVLVVLCAASVGHSAGHRAPPSRGAAAISVNSGVIAGDSTRASDGWRMRPAGDEHPCAPTGKPRKLGSPDIELPVRGGVPCTAVPHPARAASACRSVRNVLSLTGVHRT